MQRFKWATPSRKVAWYFSLSFVRFCNVENALHIGDNTRNVGSLSFHAAQAFATTAGSLKFQPVLKSNARPGRRSNALDLSVNRPGLNTSMMSGDTSPNAASAACMSSSSDLSGIGASAAVAFSRFAAGASGSVGTTADEAATAADEAATAADDVEATACPSPSLFLA